MKGIKYLLSCLTILLSTILSVAPTPVSASSANNFYFSDAKFDYTLGKDSEGVSTLKVKETLTAEFPNTNQNHGITRYIPRTNQAGKNVTVENRRALNFSVTRNGAKEPVAKTEEENGAYVFYVGDADIYVHGTQVYVLEYEFKNVITNFDDFQELYWDTNGTGWTQKFDHLTATLHIEDEEIAKNLKLETWCYVGKYGAKGENRCTKTTDAAKNLVFTTENLKAGENLTFVAQFEPGTFNVTHYYNYALVIISVIVTLICGLIIFLSVRHWLKKGKKKHAFRKHLLLAPEYTAPKDLTVAEAEQILLKSPSRASYVATLLELVVSKKIEIIKGEPTGILKKDTWKVKVLDNSNLTESQTCMLKILNGGGIFTKGSVIDVKKHTASSSLVALGRKYRSSATDSLKRRGLLEEKAKSNSSGNMIALIAIAIVFFVPGCAIIGIVASDWLIGDVVGRDFLYPYLFILIPASIIISTVLVARTARYATRTEAGLEMDNYLEGLKLYIKMAEKDRLAFNQSVKGAPTTAAGMVKLYEKILPYACLFGLEESWMNTLDKYYQDNDLTRPDWYTYSLINYSMFHSFSQNFNTVVVSSSSVSSSGSSGGGGGGFSGGGGGGGGGGGW